MEYRVEKMEAFTVIGPEKRLSNDTACRDCPAFWREFTESCRLRNDPPTAREQAIRENRIGELGVCVCQGDNAFRYVIGGFYRGGPVPEGMCLTSFPAMEWAKFPGRGRMPDALQALNREIYGRWLPEHGEYALAMSANIEWYSEGDTTSGDYEFAIWLPVRKTH